MIIVAIVRDNSDNHDNRDNSDIVRDNSENMSGKIVIIVTIVGDNSDPGMLVAALTFRRVAVTCSSSKTCRWCGCTRSRQG